VQGQELSASLTDWGSNIQLKNGKVFNWECFFEVVLAVNGDDFVLLVQVVELELGGKNTLAKGFLRLVD
jgi:hypothetical protein